MFLAWMKDPSCLWIYKPRRAHQRKSMKKTGNNPPVVPVSLFEFLAGNGTARRTTPHVLVSNIGGRRKIFQGDLRWSPTPGKIT